MVGRVRIKLAKLLQESFPLSLSGLALTWRPEKLYPATGAYRTNQRLECWRWEGSGVHVREDGSEFTVMAVGSYVSMSELIKSSKLGISESGEVVPLK